MDIYTPLPSPKIFNPSNHMTHRAIKNVLQSESTVKSWWHESEVPSGRDQRLSFFGSQCFVPIKKKFKKRFASQNLSIKNKRKPLGPGYLIITNLTNLSWPSNSQWPRTSGTERQKEKQLFLVLRYFQFTRTILRMGVTDSFIQKYIVLIPGTPMLNGRRYWSANLH